MNDKLRKKLEKQNKKTEMLMGNYSSGGMKNTTRRSHSKGNLWNHTNLPKIKPNIEIIIG